MPPEPGPWGDRKDFFRDRKHHNHNHHNNHHNNHHHHRSEALLGNGGGGGPPPPPRWRDSLSSPRWAAGGNGGGGFPSSDFRRPPGHGKQGGWHMYPDDPPHYGTPRGGDRFLDEDGFRPSGPRGDGRYGRFYRDGRPSFVQREWRGHSWENNHHHNGPSTAPGRMHSVNDQKSVGDSPMRASHPHSEPSDQVPSKNQADKVSEANGSGTGQRLDKENSLGSLDWKPLKWSRSGSLTSRGSGLNPSSSSKSLGGEPNEVKVDLPPKTSPPVQSPSDDGTAFAPSAAQSDDNASRKKPRLGWGEGLAKYEKKVVGPEENENKSTHTISFSNVEPVQSLSSNLVDKSPRVAGFSDCSSPATPSSVACSSSPGMEDKAFGKTSDSEADANNFCVSSVPMSENQLDGLHFILEKLELNSIANLGSLLSEMLQAEEQCPMDSGFVRSSALKKLLLLKGDISKELEVTEFEIDSLENELKLLKPDTASSSPCRTSSNCLSSDPCENLNALARPPPLEVMSSGDMIEEDKLLSDDVKGASAENKVADIESPGTATSKFVEALSVEKSLYLDEHQNISGDAASGEFDQCLTGNFAMVTDVEKPEGISGHVDDGIVFPDDNPTAVVQPLNATDGQEDKVYNSILAANREAASGASELLDKLLPSGDWGVDGEEATGAPDSLTDSTVKEKFRRRKQYLRFKERVISMKYRAFQHLWKEDLRILSLRSQRAKLQKKLDPSSRTLHNGSQKYRSSVRARFTSPAGSLSLVPTTEVINFTGKLLSDSHAKIYRSTLRMPSMILDEKEKVMSKFVSNNGLVDDPCAVEKERALINPWTFEEKEIFMDKLAIYGKDFRKIASFLDHKTTADCIDFYYKNHKSECFDKTNKKLELKKQGKPLSSSTYLVASGKKWGREMNAASLDLLGAASVIAAQEDEAMESLKFSSVKSTSRKLRTSDGMFEASSGYNNTEAEDERETAAVLAGIGGSFSSEAMSSCITSSVEPGEDGKQQKVGSSAKRPLTPEVTQNVDDDTCSDESCGEMDPVDWTDDEKLLFMQAFSSYGKDFIMISRCVRTKTRDQCKVFFSKGRKCLGLDSVHPGCGSGVPARNDSNGGGSDTEDACIVETNSAAYCDKSTDRLDDDLAHMNEDVCKPEITVAESSALVEDCDPAHSDHKLAISKPESVCAGDHRVEVSDLPHHGGMVDVQESKLVPGDNPRFVGQLAGKDDTSMVHAPIDIVAFESSPLASSVDVGSNGVSNIADEQSVVKLKPRGADVPSEPVGKGGSVDDLCKQSANGNVVCHPQSGSCIMNEGISSKHLNGFPLDLSIRTELNGFSSQKSGKGPPIQNGFLRKCSSVPSRPPVTELPLLVKSEDQNGYARPSCSSRTEKPCGNGDVKLFGKILSKTCTVDKPITQIGDGKHHAASGGLLDIRFNQGLHCNSTSDKHDPNNLLGLEEVPIRSYGFWDGTKIQTGLPTLPDSTLLLAKYPSAFANFPISSSKSEQQPLQAMAVDTKDHSDINGGACVFNSNGNVIDYPAIYRNQEELHPFRLDMKQRQNTFPEVHRNGLETISGLQQVKLNVVQGGDIFVGGSCNGITDPVAALKLHYARTQQYGASGHSGNGVIREETWTGHGDVGR